MKKVMILLFGLCTGFFSFSCPALVPDRVPCVRALETTFFRTETLYQALSLYQIPQGLWPQINYDLQNRSKTVLDRMKKKTARMVPNPIEYPMQKYPTAQILIAVLHEVFMESMVLFEVSEQPTADLIFDYLLGKQAYRFINCFGPEVKDLLPKIY